MQIKIMMKIEGLEVKISINAQFAIALVFFLHYKHYINIIESFIHVK